MRNYNQSCICCGFISSLESDDFDGRIGAICPQCNWEVDDLDDNGWSAANGATLEDWIRIYKSKKA